MTILPLTVGDLSTNCYLITNTNNECLIVDPGDDADFITESIINYKLAPKAIVLTHAHFDHLLGCLELVLNFNLPIAIHPNDLPLLNHVQFSAAKFTGKSAFKTPKPTIMLDSIQLPITHFENIKIIHTPGHTPGSVCLHFENILVTGDTLFAEGVGRTDFSYSDTRKLYSSLDVLKKLPEDTLIYPGHESYGVSLGNSLSNINLNQLI